MAVHSLVYIADPMCSWCWGFSPVLEEIRRHYEGRVSFQLMLGGLRPGNTERFDASRRAYILNHWHAVHNRTGQPFNFEFQMGPNFIYDTDPASRAIGVIRKLMSGKEWDFLKRIQKAFYVQNADVTSSEILGNLALELGMDPLQFSRTFQDSKTKELVWDEFDQARQFGVDGFPTLIGLYGKTVSTLMHGFQDFETLVPLIDKFLEKAA